MAAARLRLGPALAASALCHCGVIAALAAYTLPPPAPAPAHHSVTLAFVHPPLAKAEPPSHPSPPPQPARTESKPAVKPAAKPRPAAVQPPAQASEAAAPAVPAMDSPPGSARASALPLGEPDPPPLLPVILTPDYLSPPVPPVYPPAARRLQIEGTVVVRALVERPGHPSQVTLWRSSGESLLDRSALEAVRGWRFRPMTHSGGMVAAWVEVPITFSISNT